MHYVFLSSILFWIGSTFVYSCFHVLSILLILPLFIHELRVFVSTWNVGGVAPDEDLNIDDLLETDNHSCDIYILGYGQNYFSLFLASTEKHILKLNEAFIL